MDTGGSSQLFRADHVKRHAYHLIIQKNDQNVVNKCSNDLLNNTNNKDQGQDSSECDYSVGILGQFGYILDYGSIDRDTRWKQERIFKRFNKDIKLDDQAAIDASLDVEAEFISQRYYLHSNKLAGKSSKIKDTVESNGYTYNAEDKDPIVDSNVPNDLDSNDIDSSLQDDVKYAIDCTCGVASNLIPIAEHFICIGIDISYERCEISRHNLRVYGLEGRAVVVNADVATFLDSIDFSNPQSFMDFGIDVTKPPFDMLLKQRFSWAFISPPWGGVKYSGFSKKSITYRLSEITSMDIKSVVAKAAALSDNVSLMLPKSQNISDLIHLSQITNLPFVTIDLLYKSSHSPLPRLCYAHFTKHLMDKCGPVKRKKFDMAWDVNDITECVDVAIPIYYYQGKINLIGTLSGNSVFNDIHTSSFVRALAESILCAIDEPIHTLPRLIDIIEILGPSQVQLLLQDTFTIYHSGGLTYTSEGVTKNRTIGGIFFYLFKIRHQNIYRQVEKKNKLRKLQGHK